MLLLERQTWVIQGGWFRATGVSGGRWIFAQQIRPGLDTLRLADCPALNGLPLSLAYIAPGYRASASLGERIPRQVMMQSLD